MSAGVVTSQRPVVPSFENRNLGGFIARDGTCSLSFHEATFKQDVEHFFFIDKKIL